MKKHPALIAFAALFLGACASAPKHEMRLENAGLRPERVRQEIPFIPQERNLCGPTVLRMMSQQKRPDLGIEDFRRMSFTGAAGGTFKNDFLSASRRAGWAPYVLKTPAAIFRHVASREAVVVFQNVGLPWWPTWHYALVTGYDLDRNIVFLHSGRTEHLEMPYARFLQTWEWGGSWSYVFMDPARMPEEADFDEALENAMVFDELKSFAESQALYESMRFRWPDRFEPYLGAANAHFRQGRSEEAVENLFGAIERNPAEPALFFNLAVILSSQGRMSEALAVKREALALVRPEKREEFEKSFGF